MFVPWENGRRSGTKALAALPVGLKLEAPFPVEMDGGSWKWGRFLAEGDDDGIEKYPEGEILEIKYNHPTNCIQLLLLRSWSVLALACVPAEEWVGRSGWSKGFIQLLALI